MADEINPVTAPNPDNGPNDEPVANTAPTDQDGAADDKAHLTEEETQEAQKEGLKQAVVDKTKIANAMFDDLPGAPPAVQYHGSEEIQQWAYLLDLGVDAFEKRVSVDAGTDGSIPDEKVYGLLALERNGQNRTPYVKAMMKRLGLKSNELPGGGPGYTNDLTSISDL
jgi:hypothetical protein